MESFYEMLFPDQDLETIIQRLDPGQVETLSNSFLGARQMLAGGANHPPDEGYEQLITLLQASPWALFIAAQVELEQGHSGGARRFLEALATESTEARIQLWAWHNLRRLGESTPADVADRILGIVVEVPVGNSADVLATYTDGSAHYINHQGGIVVWEQHDGLITPLVQGVMQAGQLLGARREQHSQEPVAGNCVRISTLTPAGIYVWYGEPDHDPSVLALLREQTKLLYALARAATAGERDRDSHNETFPPHRT